LPLWQRLKETTETETTETEETTTETTETGATIINKPETVTLSFPVEGSEPPLPMLKTGLAMRSTLDAMELSAYLRPTFVPKEKTNPVISLLEAKATGFHGLVTRPLYEMPVGIGLPAEIIAVKCAWTWSVLRARLNKILFLV